MKRRKRSNQAGCYMPLCMCLGISLGTAVGVAVGRLSVWMVLGMSIGLCIGALIDASKRKKNGDAASDGTDEADSTSKQ